MQRAGDGRKGREHLRWKRTQKCVLQAGGQAPGGAGVLEVPTAFGDSLVGAASGQCAGAGRGALSVRLKAFIQDFILKAVGSHQRFKQGRDASGSGRSLWEDRVEDQRGRASRQGGLGRASCKEDGAVVQEMCCEP